MPNLFNILSAQHGALQGGGAEAPVITDEVFALVSDGGQYVDLGVYLWQSTAFSFFRDNVPNGAYTIGSRQGGNYAAGLQAYGVSPGYAYLEWGQSQVFTNIGVDDGVVAYLVDTGEAWMIGGAGLPPVPTGSIPSQTIPAFYFNTNIDGSPVANNAPSTQWGLEIYDYSIDELLFKEVAVPAGWKPDAEAPVAPENCIWNAIYREYHLNQGTGSFDIIQINANLITNGDFSDGGSSWVNVTSGAWQFQNERAEAFGGNIREIENTSFAPTIGRTYTVSVDLTYVSGTGLRIHLGGDATEYYDASGNIEIDLTASTSDPLKLESLFSEVYVDNVSVVEKIGSVGEPTEGMN